MNVGAFVGAVNKAGALLTSGVWSLPRGAGLRPVYGLRHALPGAAPSAAVAATAAVRQRSVSSAARGSSAWLVVTAAARQPPGGGRRRLAAAADRDWGNGSGSSSSSGGGGGGGGLPRSPAGVAAAGMTGAVPVSRKRRRQSRSVGAAGGDGGGGGGGGGSGGGGDGGDQAVSTAAAAAAMVTGGGRHRGVPDGDLVDGDANAEPQRLRKKKRGAGVGQGGAMHRDVPAAPVGPAATPPAGPLLGVHADARTSKTTLSEMTSHPFASLSVAAPLLSAVRQTMGYENMTRIQAESIPVSLRGGDVLCKAKTGSGKTLAFLIPAMHRALSDVAARRSSPRRGVVPVLVVSPTRELAQQIAAEAKLLLSTSGGGGHCIQCVIGGTTLKADVAAFRRRMPLVLVGTPGRLNDHLNSPNTGLADALQGLTSLVFDEADQLLDMGFRPAIEDILQHLRPPATRQTLLFSATMPKDVRAIVRLALRPDYTTVDCVGEEEATNMHVSQTVTVVPVTHQLPVLLHALQAARRESPKTFKVIVFFTTARLTQLSAQLFNELGVPVLEIHSRKTQSARASVAKVFSAGTGLVLFTSDVSARGVDYDDVTHVVQVGVPSDTAQYVHRLGRTGRAGKSGSGLLILADFEAAFLRSLANLPVARLTADSLPTGPNLTASAERMATIVGAMPDAIPEAAYQAWLGYYIGCLRLMSWSKEQLVARANDWYERVCGRATPPALPLITVGKMGLRGTPGLLVEGRGVKASGGGGKGGGWSSRGRGGGAGGGRGKSGGRDRDGGRGGGSGGSW